jgi:hypothetical protein
MEPANRLKQLKCTEDCVLKHNKLCKYTNIICKSAGYKNKAEVAPMGGLAG